MTLTKRDFLKIAGLACIGGPPLIAAAAGQAEPAAVTKSGKRWAMVIDLSKDIDWKPVASACHLFHNVPDFVANPNPAVNNPKHEIKWIWTEPYQNAFDVPHDEAQLAPLRLREMKLPVLCNHCDNPPCVRVCPTAATFRRDDGIVMMDYHRCIGCRFCIAACPFGARSFNFKDPRLAFKDPNAKGGWAAPNPNFPTRAKGVVEKCNFCAERLELGQKPACVEAAGGAILFGDLNDPSLGGYDNLAEVLANHFSVKRRPELGTLPMVYYLV